MQTFVDTDYGFVPTTDITAFVGPIRVLALHSLPPSNTSLNRIKQPMAIGQHSQ